MADAYIVLHSDYYPLKNAMQKSIIGAYNWVITASNLILINPLSHLIDQDGTEANFLKIKA